MKFYNFYTSNVYNVKISRLKTIVNSSTQKKTKYTEKRNCQNYSVAAKINFSVTIYILILSDRKVLLFDKKLLLY